MTRNEHARRRDLNVERRERQRYEVLERLYLVAGEGCEHALIEVRALDDFGLPDDALGGVVEDLERLGYLARDAASERYGLTERGVEYLQRGAWRRSSIRH